MKKFILSIILISMFATFLNNANALNKCTLLFQSEANIYRVTAYYSDAGGNWKTMAIKVKVTQPSYGSETLEVVAYKSFDYWTECYPVQTQKLNSADPLKENFDYKVYINARLVYFSL